ncbi:preprotein translocase subunit SecG [Methylovulum miyakonense]|uniref:preprotein translocase subunit SecG n=1 Tax=Methylovulum miyakonense TaxID=645578 RepID=UPI0003A59896|nr:preprotein translocase subunit SecG [Methylovulum miyakonense]
MYQIIIVIHVLLGLGIIGLILIQQGKGADAGASFGSGSSGSVFGAQGAGSFLSRTTATLATLFFITSLGLAILNGRQGAAYDLMSSEAVKKDPIGIPQADSPKTAESAPIATETKTEEMPLTSSTPVIKQAIEQMSENPAAIPSPATTEAKPPESSVPATTPEIKETVVPKAEEIKTVEPLKVDEKKAAASPAEKNKKEAKKTVKEKKKKTVTDKNETVKK